MERDTFRNRVAALARKSRKAISLYNSVEKRNVRDLVSGSTDLADRAVLCWKEVNTDLFRRLSQALSLSLQKEFVQELYHIRDHFYTQWRQEESKLARGVKDIEVALDQRDFIRACRISEFLALSKATAQASEAASAELQAVLEFTNSSYEELGTVDVSFKRSSPGEEKISGKDFGELPREFAQVAESMGLWSDEASSAQVPTQKKLKSENPSRPGSFFDSEEESGSGNIIPITRIRSR